MVETFSAGTTFLTDICLLRSSSDCGFTDILMSKNADANCTVYGHKRQTSRVDIRPLRAFEGRESTAQNLERYVRIVRPQLLTLLRYCTHIHTTTTNSNVMHTHVRQERRENSASTQVLFVVCFSGQSAMGNLTNRFTKSKISPTF